MEWGIPTLIEAPDPEQAAALCRKLGFHFVELNANLPQYQQWDVPLLKDISRRYGIYFTIHLDEKMDLGDFNPRIAEAYLQTLLETIDAARQLGVPILNMHLNQGVYFTLPDRKAFLYHDYRTLFLERLAKAVGQCNRAAQGDLAICIENTGNFHLPFLQEAASVFLQAPLFGLTFDIGHNHSAGDVDRPFILERQDRLRHFHIHDAQGKKNHLSLGTGEINLPWFISFAEKNHCRAVLEVKTIRALAESAEWLKRNQLFG